MRQTTIKKGAIDLDSVFSPGFLTDNDGRLITGYKWDRFLPALNPNSISITSFQMPKAPHVVDNIVLLYMFVNGVKVEPNYLGIDLLEDTIIIYNDTDYPITSEDVVDIWYVATSNVGGEPIQDPAPPAQAAGLQGHLQINNGSDVLTFAPVKWLVNALVPDQDAVYDLGTANNQWNDLYLSGNTIYLAGVPLSIDSETSNLLVSGNPLPTINDVAPATLLQDQDFVTAITGPQGPQGPQGVQGPVGAQGPTGLTGPQGIQGIQGADGQDGAQGAQGIQGPQGVQGVQGPAGPQGPAGTGITFQGSVATVNDLPGNGSQGDAYIVQADDSLHVHDGTSFVNGGSIQGPQGQQGIQGVTGPQGIQGPQGADGAQGPAGQDGAQGPAGASGASVTNLTITNTTIAATLSDNSTINGSISMNINSLSDVDITNTAHTLSDGYVLTWDSTHGHWHPESPGQVSVGSLSIGNTSVDLSDAGSDGTITFNTEGTDRWKFNSSGHLIPNANATYDIGEAENKVRHFYLSNNSLIFESGSLGVDADSDLSFTPSGGEAKKIATKAYVDANAGGGGGSATEKMIVDTGYFTLSHSPTYYYPWYAFSKLRYYTNGVNFFDSNYKILTKTISGTTLVNDPATFNLPMTHFPPGNYRFIWAITIDPSASYWSNLITSDKIAGYIYSSGYSVVSQLSALHNVHYSNVSHKPAYLTAASANINTPQPDGLEVKIEVIFTLATQSSIKLWDNNSNTIRNWLGSYVTLYREYQEIEKLSNYDFTGSLTL